MLGVLFGFCIGGVVIGGLVAVTLIAAHDRTIDEKDLEIGKLRAELLVEMSMCGKERVDSRGVIDDRSGGSSGS